MKILYCTNQLKVHGGIERILSQKINYLINEMGHDVILITYEQTGNFPIYSLDDKLKHFDIGINYNPNISYFHPENLLKALRHFFHLKLLIKKIQPDIIISVSYTPDQYFIPFINKAIPKIKELHSSGIVVAKVKLKQNKIKNFISIKLFDLLKKYNKLVLLNKDEVNYFNDFEIEVIPNFTDFKINNSVTIKKEKTIIAAGRIVAVKQFDELMHVWHLINKDFPEWKVCLFGDGDVKTIQYLRQLIIDLDIQSSFNILESVPNIQNEMQKASIYAMTSATECFPMVLLEAKVCGLPIVSYDCPNGPRNIIFDTVDGFLINQNNRVDYAQKLAKLMKNDHLRNEMSQNAILNIEKFSIGKVMFLWNQLFRKIVVYEND